MSGAALLLHVLVFPGFLFLLVLALAMEYVDRKAVALLQSRVGPPPLQPLADLVKLLGKEVVEPAGADRGILDFAPALSVAAVATAFLHIPVLGPSPLAFEGDLVVVLYLLTFPTVAVMLLGWASRNVYAAVGGLRAATQMFIYEVPLYLALLGPAIAAGSWSISRIVEHQSSHPWSVVWQPVGFLVALVGLQAKLERTPFDIPDAETEIIAGPLTEVSGRRLALVDLARDASLAAGCALVAALFLGGPLPPPGASLPVPPAVEGFAWFLVKSLAVLLLLSVARAATARIRIDQLDDFGWRTLTAAALAQTALVLVLGGGTGGP